MSANSFGKNFVVTSFGESHGKGLGCIIDGCPSNVKFSDDILIHELERRRPGQHLQSRNKSPSAEVTAAIVSQRKEADIPEVLSGVFEGKTLGTPIAIIVKNTDAQSQDYAEIKNSPRVGHADDVWKNKFLISDYRGGGRSSGRETIARVMAGSVACMVLKELAPKLSIHAYISQLGNLSLSTAEEQAFLQKINSSPVAGQIFHPIDEYFARFPVTDSGEAERAFSSAQHQGESFGAQVKVIIKNVPANLGQPVFHKFKADLASAVLGIGAISGFELGEGIDSHLGTEFHSKNQRSQYGGIRGGISTGEDVLFSVRIKPTSSILDVAKKGRHDPCIGIRAIPVIESMVALVVLDHLLWTRLDH